MAEGWGKRFLAQTHHVFSAGIETHGLNPFAVQVMEEVGVDISGHVSQRVKDLPEDYFDLVITVCGHAHEHCPVFLGEAQVVHHGFADPPQLAQGEVDAEKVLDHYRGVRDEIRDFVKGLA